MRAELLKLIGNRVRQAREGRDMSQEELARKAGCHRTYVGMVERAEKSVSVERLATLCKALGTTLSDLLRGL